MNLTRISFLLLSCCCLTVVQAQTPTFYDDFERGALTPYSQGGASWGGSNTSPGDSISISTDRAVAGTRSLKFHFAARPEDEDNWVEQRFNPGQPLVEFSILYSLYLPSNFVHRNVPGSDNNKGVAQFWSGAYGSAASNQHIGFEYWPSGDGGSVITCNRGQDGVALGHIDGGGETGTGSMFRLSERGKWIQFRVYIKLASAPGQADGIVRVWKWVQGTPSSELIFDMTDWTYSNRGNYIDQSYILGWANSGFSQNTDFYIDNFAFLKDGLLPWPGLSPIAEANVTGSGANIGDGDSTPAVADGTDFGSLNPTTQSLTRTYTIQNVGAATLAVNAVTISGANASDFTVITQPASNVASGASTTFTVKFDPVALGSRSATLSFVTNDTDENPYNFAIRGRGDYVIDNADVSGMTWIGSWTLSTATPSYFLANYRHDGNTLKGSKSARFTPNLLAAGSYEVFLRWPAATNRATNVPVDIVTAGGTVAAGPVDQRRNGGLWNSLGIYSFNAGTGGSVLLKNAGTTDVVVADAVMFAPAEVIVDNMDGTPSVVKTGGWVTSTYLPASIYGSNCWHDDNTGQGSKSVRFTPDLPTAGNYEVYTRWTAATNRASNVPVDVVTADGTVIARQVDQSSNGGVWFSLGIHPFNAGISGSVLIRNTGTNGYVVADAVRFVKRP